MKSLIFIQSMVLFPKQIMICQHDKARTEHRLTVSLCTVADSNNSEIAMI